MNLRRHKVSKDTLTTRRRSSLLTSDQLLLNIPIDLIIEIFSRLPLKSIARCRCVSKQWASVLRHPDFTDFFFTKSLTRPKLLFACGKDDKKKVIFFSTPQPQNLGENVSLIASNDHASFSFERVNNIRSSVNGYFCISDDRILEGMETELVLVIRNPSTGQSITLPKVKTRNRKGTAMRSFLGYDPVEKQYKVLSVTILNDNSVVDLQVLTLGAGNMTWRSIECDIPHSSPGITCKCINGVLYYIARASRVDSMIVCFDVRSEKFSFVKPVERGMLVETLIDFQGKLASVRSSSPFLASGTSKSFEIWILEDAEKHEWSKRVFNIPPLWKDAAPREILYFAGVADTSKFVFGPCFPSDRFNVYYYNFVKKAITRVEIQGMRAFDQITSSRMRIYVNHVEDVKLMELF